MKHTLNVLSAVCLIGIIGLSGYFLGVQNATKKLTILKTTKIIPSVIKPIKEQSYCMWGHFIEFPESMITTEPTILKGSIGQDSTYVSDSMFTLNYSATQFTSDGKYKCTYMVFNNGLNYLKIVNGKIKECKMQYPH